jgi:ABC-type transporter Mla subunit MlaD
VAESGGRAVERAAETVAELAERAVVAAREAQRLATPALRSAAHSSAESLSRAAEKAAAVLADAADRLSHEVAEIPATAKGRRAAEKEAEAARPRRWRRRLRRTLVVTAAAGAVYVVITKTPLKAKLSELIFGPPLDDEEPEPITLPVTPAADGGTGDAVGETDEAETRAPRRGRRAASTPPTEDDGAPA